MTGRTLTEVADQLNRRHRAAGGRGLPPLLMLTDERRLPDPLAVLERLKPRSGILFRHYSLPSHERRRLAESLRSAARERHLTLLIAEDAALARAVHADGLHWPERRVADRSLRNRLPPHWLITAAAHSPGAIHRAARAGADAVLLSPIFPTKSHPGAPALGLPRAALWLRQAPLPVYALGGVSHETAPLLLPFPFAGLAAVGVFGEDSGVH